MYAADGETPIVYTVAETTGYPGYTPSTTGQVASGETITNTQTPTTAYATKEWQNADGTTTAPTGATVVYTLYADGEATDYTVTLDGTPEETAPTVTGGYESEAWTATFVNLPMYAADGETPIVYTIAETTGYPGYTQSTTDPVESGKQITNEQDVTSVTVKKEWDDDSDRDKKRPPELTLTLMVNGDPVTNAPDPEITVSEDGNTWTYTWNGLPKTDSTGEDIVYTIAEENVPEGYTCDTTTAENGGTITNKHDIETVDLTVKKVWDDAENQDGKRPESVTVKLSDGKTEVTLNAENQWTATVSGLPKNEGGKPIEYTWTEENLPAGYSVKNETEGLVTTLTNSYTPGMTTVNVTKTWNDEENKDGLRPESITVRLLADGKEIKSVTITEKENWKYTFTNLPVKANGKDIVYTVTEDEVKEYTTEITGSASEGYTIKNSHEIPPEYPFTFTKRWESDPLNKITWTMYNPDGTVADSSTFKKTVIDKKKWRFDAIFTTDTDYYILEDVPEGYQVRYENVGKHAGDTKRCYNGGTIINYKVPITGDTANPALWIGMVLLGAGALGGTFLYSRKKRSQK